MLRRCVRRAYRYQEFEMHGVADLPISYPREAPNTSVFSHYQDTFWQSWGWGRQELWFDTNSRRYNTFWQSFRSIVMLLPVFCYIFPFGLPYAISRVRYGDYGMRPFLALESRYPFDNLYIERGNNTLDAEWLRHIHSKESY